jgi:uncharacterized protein DUF2799
MAFERNSLLALLVLSGCAADPSNLSAYCTPENAFRIGSESRAYFGVCPKASEAAFLAGLERGRTYRPPTPSAYPYIDKMRETERQLIAAQSESERANLRARLTDLEWWAMHLMTAPGSYGAGQ